MERHKIDTVGEETLTTGVSTKLQLLAAPVTETGAVKAWEEPVVMKSYMPAAPDRNPLFLEKRVYQVKLSW